MAGAVSLSAGELIDDAMRKQGIGNRTLVKARVAEAHPELVGGAWRKKVESLRSQIQKWRRKPAGCIEPTNAEWMARHLGLAYEDLVCRDLSEEERRLRKADRLEAQARELRQMNKPHPGGP